MNAIAPILLDYGSLPEDSLLPEDSSLPEDGSLPEDNRGLIGYSWAKIFPNDNSLFHVRIAENYNSDIFSKNKFLDYSRALMKRRESQSQQMRIDSALKAVSGSLLKNLRINDISKGVGLYEIEETENEKKKKALRAKIEEYRKLLPDFDGDDGHAPAPKDIKNAKSFIRHIPGLGVDTVATVVAGDGEVGFEWKKPEHYLEVTFADEEISFFGDMPNGGERLNGDAVYDENAIPDKLQRLISAIFPTEHVEE